MSEQLLAEFHSAMLGIYHAALKLKPPYRASQFHQMVQNLGGKETADQLLATVKPSSGFTELYLRGKANLRLSVEYLVLTNPWRTLFDDNQLAVARKRLKEVECPPPPEDSE